MAQAARPLPDDRPAPRPRLRAVPPPRRPSPEVIRRRRAVAVGGLLGLIGVPLAVLALTGGGPSGTDSEQIRALLARGAAQPATLCDHLSTGMLRAVGGHDACVKASPTRGPSGQIDSVRVSGDTAHAVVIQDTGTEAVRLVRQGGEWKVDDVR